MLANLLMTSVLFAQAPAAEAAPVGVAPQIMELKPNANGKIMVQATRVVEPKAGAAAPGGAKQPFVVTSYTVIDDVELSSVKDLTITTAAGKEVTKEDALKSLAKGGFVIISADGKKISPAYLKLFKDEVLVLAAPNLVAVNSPRGGGRMAARPNKERPAPPPNN
jgi:hypothetical protein